MIPMVFISVFVFVIAMSVLAPRAGDDKKRGTPCERPPAAKLVVGLLAIIAGTLFLLDHQGIIHVPNLWDIMWRGWPVIFILIGIGKLFESNNRDKVVGAGVMFLLGIGWLLLNFGYFHWQQIWPAALIIFGVLLLIQAIQSHDSGAASCPNGNLKPYAVFGSVEKNINDGEFTGGDFHTVFGSIEIDLSRAQMKDDSATINLHVVFGSVEMRVPDTWKVDVQSGAVFGSCENKTRLAVQPTPKTLIIRGDVIFGSVEIRN